MNDNLSSMITPKNLVKDNLSRVMPLRSKGVVMVDHFIRARWKIMKFDFFIFNVSLLAASQTVCKFSIKNSDNFVNIFTFNEDACIVCE